MQYCAHEWLFIEEAISEKLVQVTDYGVVQYYIQIVIVTWLYRLAVWLFSTIWSLISEYDKTEKFHDVN